MCRRIKTFRPPYLDQVTEDDTMVAALQYFHKVSGFRKPSKANQKAFDKAVREIAHTSGHLLAALEVRVPA